MAEHAGGHDVKPARSGANPIRPEELVSRTGMGQKYPTREQAQNISTSTCDHEDCDTCEIKRWCCYEDAGRECGASMVAMHDEINKLRELVREMRVCLNRNMPVTDRLWEESIALLGSEAQKGRED